MQEISGLQASLVSFVGIVKLVITIACVVVIGSVIVRGFFAMHTDAKSNMKVR